MTFFNLPLLLVVGTMHACVYTTIAVVWTVATSIQIIILQNIIQGDSPSMLTPIFSFNNEFIQIQIFGIIKYTQRP